MSKTQDDKTGPDGFPGEVLNDYQDARREAERRKREQVLAQQRAHSVTANSVAEFREVVSQGWAGLVPHFLAAATARGNPGLQTFLVREVDRPKPAGVLRGWVIGELPEGICRWGDADRLLVLLQGGELVRATPMDNQRGSSTCPHDPRWTYRASGEWAPLAGAVSGTITGISRHRLEHPGITPQFLMNGATQGSQIVDLLRQRIGELSSDYGLPVEVEPISAEEDTSRISFHRFGFTGRVSSTKKRLKSLLLIAGWAFISWVMVLIAVASYNRTSQRFSDVLTLVALSVLASGPIAALVAGFPKHLKVKVSAKQSSDSKTSSGGGVGDFIHGATIGWVVGFLSRK